MIVMMWQQKQCSINLAGPRCGKTTGDSTYKNYQWRYNIANTNKYWNKTNKNTDVDTNTMEINLASGRCGKATGDGGYNALSTSATPTICPSFRGAVLYCTANTNTNVFEIHTHQLHCSAITNTNVFEHTTTLNTNLNTDINTNLFHFTCFTSLVPTFCTSIRSSRNWNTMQPWNTAVWARNEKWKIHKRKMPLTLFCTEWLIYHDIFLLYNECWIC